MSPIRMRLITIRIDGMVFNNFEAQTFIRPHGRLVIRLNIENYPLSSLFHHAVKAVVEQWTA